jgi:hypothetical protein
MLPIPAALYLRAEELPDITMVAADIVIPAISGRDACGKLMRRMR